ncbi:MAG TPA: hypothetical protein VEC99_04465, partial [Clostridia bacterium]|nr:hypothetical protein [Clostridia bacterium]
SSNAPAALGGDTATLDTKVSEELLSTEKERFVAVAINTIWRKPSSIVLEMEVSRWHPDTTISLFLFPYGSGKPFSHMPKLHLNLKAESHEVLDQNRRLPKTSVEIIRSGKKLAIHAPMELLEGGTKLLCSARTQFGLVPLDWTPWRVMELSE